MGAVKQWLLECQERGGFDTWHEFACSLKDEGRSTREERFIEDMIRLTKNGVEPSSKQCAWLQDIHERVEEGHYLDEVWDD
jgi:hypothetical protein